MNTVKTILHAWLRSLEDTHSGGHFHWTAGLIGLIAVLVVGAVLLRGLARPVEGEPVAGIGGIALAAAVTVIAVVALTRHSKTPAVPPIVIHKTTIVQHITHVAAAHPVVSGWQVVAIAAAGLVATIAIIAIRGARGTD